MTKLTVPDVPVRVGTINNIIPLHYHLTMIIVWKKSEIHMSTHYNKQILPHPYSSKVKSKFFRWWGIIRKNILMWKTLFLSFFRNDLLKANLHAYVIWTLKRYFLFCKLHIWLVGFKYIATTYQIYSSFESAFSNDLNSSRVLFCPFIYCFYEKLHSVYGLLTSMYIRLIFFWISTSIVDPWPPIWRFTL